MAGKQSNVRIGKDGKIYVDNTARPGNAAGSSPHGSSGGGDPSPRREPQGSQDNGGCIGCLGQIMIYFIFAMIAQFLYYWLLGG